MSGQELGTQEMRVLVVDDMQEVFDKLRGLERISNGNVHLYLFKTREEALSELRGNPEYYGWVISDYHLGYVAPQGGLGVIKGARNINPGIGIVGMSRENHEDEMLDAGADKFMFKKQIFDNLEGFLEVLQGGR